MNEKKGGNAGKSAALRYAGESACRAVALHATNPCTMRVGGEKSKIGTNYISRCTRDKWTRSARI